MNRIGRRVCAAVNPVSTAVTGWWCHSAIRHQLTGYGPTGYGPTGYGPTGYGPTARQRRLIRRGVIRGNSITPSAEQMKARATAIDQLLGQDDHQM
jgi:hypothetical protein